MALEFKKPTIKIKEVESKQEDSNESGSTEVAEFIDNILTAAVVIHKMHLRVTGPGSYATHKALNELYDALPDHADDIAEAYQGYKGVILPDVAEVNQKEYLSMPPIDYVQCLINDVDEQRECFGNVSALQNKVDELLGTLYSVKYKLKFLS